MAVFSSRQGGVQLTGDKELDRALEKLGGPVARKVVRKAMTKASRLVKDHAKRRITAMGLVDTGRMRKQIKSRTSLQTGKRAPRGVVQRFVMTGTRAEMGIPADSPWYYPAIVEYGHDNAPPKGFMRATFVHSDAPARRLVLKDIRAMVRRPPRG